MMKHDRLICLIGSSPWYWPRTVARPNPAWGREAARAVAGAPAIPTAGCTIRKPWKP